MSQITKKEFKQRLGVTDRRIAEACGVKICAVRAWGDKLPWRHAPALVALAKQRGVNITLEELA